MSDQQSCLQCCQSGGRQEPIQDDEVVVRLGHTRESVLCSVNGMQLRCGDDVVVPTRYGDDIARVLGCVTDATRDEYDKPVAIIRTASDEDRRIAAENDRDADEALGFAKQLVDQRGLSMSMVSAHYSIDRSRLVLLFTAETRVDFRDLVKDLVHEYRVRIELRQIGVRDESRIVGGLGICGRVLCCNGVSDRLKAVSIRMAKAQNLSLNSAKISGPCERLLCCLEYEYDFYRDAKRGVPGVGARVYWGEESLRVSDVNLLTRVVRIDNRERSATLSAERIRYDSGDQRWVVLDDAGDS